MKKELDLNVWEEIVVRRGKGCSSSSSSSSGGGRKRAAATAAVSSSTMRTGRDDYNRDRDRGRNRDQMTRYLVQAFVFVRSYTPWSMTSH